MWLISRCPRQKHIGVYECPGWLIAWYLFRVTAFKYWLTCTQKRRRMSLRAEDKRRLEWQFDVPLSRALQLWH